MNSASTIRKARELCAAQKPHEALVTLDDARRTDKDPSIIMEMALILESMKLPDQAAALLEEGIKLHPHDEHMAIAYGNQMYRLNKADKGLAVTSALVQATHVSNALLLTHAHLLKASGQADNAEPFYHQALQKEKNNSIALSSLGTIELDKRHYTEALAYLTAAHKADPGNAYIETQLAYAEFRSGNLKDGWRHYEARFGKGASQGTVEKRPHAFPLWNGKPLQRGKLLVWFEQAVGEELLYATMLDDIASFVPQGIVVECDARLVHFFRQNFRNMEFIARTTPPDKMLSFMDIEAQTPAGYLGHILREDFADFPANARSLLADAEKTAQLRDKYLAEKNRLGKNGKIIGLSWKSKPFMQGDPKSIRFQELESLFARSPHLFISLQHGDIEQELYRASGMGWPLIADKDINQQQSLEDFAAQVSAMDSVITVSNTTAHMAGICGVPAAVLLPYSAGLMWHWFDKAHMDASTSLDTSPWYPCIRLFRQEIQGEWGLPLRRAVEWVNR